MPLFTKRTIHQEVRAFPSRGAVTDVSPQEYKEEFRNREFHVLEVLSSLQAGRIASNAVLVQSIENLQALVGSIATTKYKLSHDGRQLVSDLDAVLASFRDFILEKNQDEILQKIAFHSALAARSTDLGGISGRESRETMSKGTSGMMTLVRLLLSNPNFRGILGDVMDVVRAIYSKEVTLTKGNRQDQAYGSKSMRSYRATNAPIGDDSGIMADTSEQSGWARESIVSRDWAYGEPIMTRSIPPERKVYIDDSMMDEYQSDTPVHHSRRRRHGYMAEDFYANDSWEEGERRRTITGDSAVHSRQTTAQSPIDILPMDTSLAPSKLIPGRLGEAVAKVREAVPATTRASLDKRVRTLLQHLADDPEYQISIGYLVDMITTLAQAPLGTTTPRHVDANVYSVAIELKRLLEALAGTSMTPLLDAIFQITVLMRSDVHLKALVQDSQIFLERCMRDPTYMYSSDFSSRLEVLQDRGRVWADTPQMQSVMEHGLAFVDALRNDRITRTLARDISRLYGTMFYAPSGRLVFKGDLINDLRAVVLPAVLTQLRYIALPRIEHRDSNMDLILDNVILTSANFVPNLFELEMVNRAQMSPRAEISDRFTHVFSLNAYQIQCDIHDVSFYYRKRRGFPRVTDWGVLDLAIAGEGVSVSVMFEYDRHGAGQTLVPLRVRADVDDLQVKVHHSKHDMLFRLASPVIRSTIRRALITTIEQTVLTAILKLDGVVTDFKDSRWMQGGGVHAGAGRRAPSFVRKFVPGFVRGTHHYEAPSHSRHRQPLSRSRSRSRSHSWRMSSRSM